MECWSQHGASPLCTLPLPPVAAKVPLKHKSDIYITIPNSRKITTIKYQQNNLVVGGHQTWGTESGTALGRLGTTAKGYALKHSQPRGSLQRHSEDTLANTILTLTTTQLYAEYLNKKKSKSEQFFCYFILL